MRLGSSAVLALVALFFLSKSGKGASDRGSSGPGQAGTGRQMPRIQTGGDDVRQWARQRRALVRAMIAKPGVLTPPELDDISLSVLAQWAHETASGKSEFNFNLGGWNARAKDDFFLAKDVLSNDGTERRWTSYDTLPAAVEDQLKRLHDNFPTAVELLIKAPKSSAWVEELGRRGYYTAKPDAYARAWATHRAELSELST